MEKKCVNHDAYELHDRGSNLINSFRYEYYPAV